jgi:hypothetical protein
MLHKVKLIDINFEKKYEDKTNLYWMLGSRSLLY